MSTSTTGLRVHLLVWDLPTRLFHWTLVALVALAWATGETEGFWFTVHAYAGYGVLVLLVFRLLWGVWGSRHSLFSDFVRSWVTVRAYAARLLAFRAPRSIGHNPLGGWMIILLMTALTVIVATGLFTAGEMEHGQIVAGPLAHYIPAGAAHAMKEIHEVFFNLLLVLVGIHIVGVVTGIVLTRDDLIRAMVTGYKDVMPEQAAGETGVMAPTWRALAALALAVAATWFVVTY
ncbi:MAG: cytochrome b/b6 domain-containing protein [Alphaproteobacteria bacterium]